MHIESSNEYFSGARQRQPRFGILQLHHTIEWPITVTILRCVRSVCAQNVCKLLLAMPYAQCCYRRANIWQKSIYKAWFEQQIMSITYVCAPRRILIWREKKLQRRLYMMDRWVMIKHAIYKLSNWQNKNGETKHTHTHKAHSNCCTYEQRFNSSFDTLISIEAKWNVKWNHWMIMQLFNMADHDHLITQQQ